MRGYFITFEGAEGSGKSTQAKMLYQHLSKRKRMVCLLREPGGVAVSEKIRKILLDVKNKEMSAICEMLLYMASRAQLVEEKIIPALKKGHIVISDRFLDSTLAYQGYGFGIDLKMIRKIGWFATQKIQPDLTLVFDLSVERGLSRIKKTKDRIEKRPLSYHQRVHGGYLTIARREPKRVKIIRANQGKEKIQKIVRNYVEKMIQ